MLCFCESCEIIAIRTIFKQQVRTNFLDHLADSSLNSLILEESCRRIGLAFNADSSFDLSFDSAILKNLSYWLGLQTLAKGIPVSAEALPLLDIVITASRRGPQDLLFAVPL